jgi:hypothetical protein
MDQFRCPGPRIELDMTDLSAFNPEQLCRQVADLLGTAKA